MTPTDTPNSVGAQQNRKPWTAANLSFLLAGLGQVYCGDIRKGLTHMWLIGTVLLACTAAVAAPIPARGSALLILFIAGIAVSGYSAYSAYQAARRTREDYRLKEYNRGSCYTAFIFLFAIPVIGFVSLLRANFAEVYVVPNASMSPTIPAGSRVVVRRDSYLQSDPEINDLVAFKNPENRRQTFIKRVVANAGDVFEIRDGVVLVDGKPVEEPPSITVDKANFAKITVPEHHCFVLGDLRENSKDSRHFGPVPHIALVGKVMFAR